jgi:hypothetical protein
VPARESAAAGFAAPRFARASARSQADDRPSTGSPGRLDPPPMRVHDPGADGRPRPAPFRRLVAARHRRGRNARIVPAPPQVSRPLILDDEARPRRRLARRSRRGNGVPRPGGERRSPRGSGQLPQPALVAEDDDLGFYVRLDRSQPRTHADRTTRRPPSRGRRAGGAPSRTGDAQVTQARSRRSSTILRRRSASSPTLKGGRYSAASRGGRASSRCSSRS